MNDFDGIALVYDRLVMLVFGSKLWSAQQLHLNKIQPSDNILILGGGTGRILSWLSKCEVDYLDKSNNMIEKARKYGKANFIQADFLKYDMERQYDWIVCPFFLDCFKPDELDACLSKIRNGLNEKGKLLVTDFQIMKPTQRWLIKLMLFFFRFAVRLSADDLTDIKKAIRGKGFIPTESDDFLNGLVFSELYMSDRK